ncbi:hypothetical protein [Cobetia sp. QF-1]|uniref:hypothetical protein n=1 Tax=Cobetia sp. QF-1 TaxID=1969833 RepID=UPI000B54328D|nr:hypothetical protein [Cobetia sp. QF-1]
MNNSTAIINALGRFANSMRLYNEAFLKYKYLVAIDHEEAINNLDRAFEQKLEYFHSLYDVSKGVFDYNACPEANLLINIRNAIHHRNHALFHSILQTIWLDEGPEKLLGAEFLIARHRTVGGCPPPPMHLIKLEDIYFRLDPRLESGYIAPNIVTKALSKFISLENSLSCDKIWSKAKQDNYPDKQVYLDLLPIFISAVSKVFTALDRAEIPFNGFDEKTYKSVFIDELRTDFEQLCFLGLIINDVQINLGPSFTIQEASIIRGSTY